ncbi:MAG TPA: FAD-dependent oxidoreductase [Pyrinomonadaceae bacterium]|jgi:glycine/D-amino acid oxidase-like deaminating enzyme
MSNVQTIIEPERKIPVVGEWDAVVCGGGPSGFIAAIAAARGGARTLLIHEHGFLGGMATAALVGPISKFRAGGRRIVGGIAWEFVERMHRAGGAVIDLPSGNVPFDPEIYKYVSLKMVREAGVDLRLHTRAVGCLTNPEDGGQIDYVLVENASGRQAIKCGYVVDATGTGAIAHRAGLPCRLRTDAKGNLQPLSLIFRLGGVDTDNLTVWMEKDGVKYANQELKKALQREVEKGNLRQFGGPWTVFGSTIRRGEVSVNATRFAGNATDAESLTAAEIEMREDVMKMIGIFRRVSPQFSNCYLIDTAAQSGVRETRMIEGLYTMTLDDILNPKDFPDTIARGAHWIDIHQAQNSEQSATVVNESYNIPYRAIIPFHSKNLLVAGGSISASKEAFASIRVQAQCMAIGEAAGTAVASCSRRKIAVNSIDGELVNALLASSGALV